MLQNQKHYVPFSLYKRFTLNQERKEGEKQDEDTTNTHTTK